jgi:hypothetical protein
MLAVIRSRQPHTQRPTARRTAVPGFGETESLAANDARYADADLPVQAAVLTMASRRAQPFVDGGCYRRDRQPRADPFEDRQRLRTIDRHAPQKEISLPALSDQRP